MCGLPQTRLQISPGWAHALLSPVPALGPAAQDVVLSRGRPSSTPPTACRTPCARRPPQSMEPWPCGQLSWRAGVWLGHTLVDQEALVPPASTGLWPGTHRALPGPRGQSSSCPASTSDRGSCHSRGEDWSPCLQPWQTTGLLETQPGPEAPPELAEPH